MNDSTFLHEMIASEAQLIASIIKLSKDEQLAKEIVQTSMSDLWERKTKGQIKNYTNISGYLYRMAKNEWIRHQKMQGKTSELPAEMEEEDMITPKYSHLQTKAVGMAFEQLGKKCQSLLKCVTVEKQRLIDLVEALNYKTYGSIKSSKKQCIEQLKKKYQKALTNLTT